MKCISPNMKLMNNSRIRVEFEESCLKKKKEKLKKRSKKKKKKKKKLVLQGM